MSECQVIVAHPGLVTQPRLSAELITDQTSLEGIWPEWNRALAASGITHPFLTPQWISTWWDCFAGENKLHVVLIRAGEEIVGIAPLMRTRRKFYGVPVRCLEFIANLHTPRCDFIITRRHAEVYRALWNALLAHRRMWDVLLLCQLPDDSATLSEFPRLAGESRLSCGVWHSADSPYLPISGGPGGWESYFNRLGAKHRANVRRRMRRLAEIGPVRIEHVAGSGLPKALEDGFRLEGAAWKDKYGTSMQAQPQSRRFYLQLARRFDEQGWLFLSFLNVAGRRIAFNYSLCHNRSIYLLKPGYDPEHASYSPVNLLCGLCLQEAFENSLQSFDFLGAADDWKLQWTRQLRSHYWLFVFANRPRASLIHSLKFRVLPGLRQHQFYRALHGALIRQPRGAARGEHTRSD